MNHFREISESQARRVNRSIAGLANLKTFEELEERFIQESAKLLPADCMCWNNWTPDLSALTSYRNNDGYNEPFEKKLDIFGDVVGYHPLIVAGQFPDAVREVKRMSDFQGFSGFRENPLYKEVYRHLDSRFQIAYIPCILGDRSLILTWNRRLSDFDFGDMQVMHFMGMRLVVIARKLEERRFLETRLGTIRQRLGLENHHQLLSVLAELRNGKS